MKTLLYMAAMVSLFTLPGCLKSDPATPANTIQYPSMRGDYWVYKVTNYQKNTVDTVTVSVVGSTKDPLQSGNFMILQLKWTDKIDSQYVSIVNDTLAFYSRSFIVPENQFGYKMNNFIVYPLPMGKGYSSVLFPKPNGFYSSDSIKMISSQNVDVNLNKAAQGFTAFQEEKTFLLATMTPMPQFSIFIDDFVPGIGIIKETIIRQVGYLNVKGSVSGIGETWELLNCHLDNPPSPNSVNP